MRVLISSSPGIGHIYPTVSTAWALRAAGHDVILATGGNHEQAAKAGLQVVDAAPGVDFPAVFRDFFIKENAGLMDGGPDATNQDFVARLFAVVSAAFTDETVRLAREWRPDVILSTPLQAAGPLAARVVGVPAILHTIGFGQTADLPAMVAERYTADYDRFHVTPAAPAAVIDVSPPSMRATAAADDVWPMRYVPYNGGAVLPRWLREQRDRPRVTVTLGSVLPRMAGMGALQQFVETAGSVDAEFVITLGGADAASFGSPPANVRLLDWVPFNALFAASDAVIHHGGAGTTLTALDAGLPQFVLPHGADQFMNAAAVAKSGAGRVVRPSELDAAHIAELLSDPTSRTAAEAVSAELAAQPTPADLVPRIIKLAS